MARRAARTISRDRGIALFAAIWVIAVISGLALAVTREGRVVTQIVLNERAAAETREAAKAGLVWLQAALAAQARGLSLTGATEAIPLDGAPRPWAFGAATVTLQAQLEIGKLDLTGADPAVLAAVLADLAPEAAAPLTAQIIARREAALQGRISWRLDDAPLQRTGDLAALAAGTPALTRRLSPYLTTATEARAPDPLWAPAALFRALPLSDEERRLAVAARAERPSWPGGARTLTITATARAARAAPVRAEALILVDPRARPAVRVIRTEIAAGIAAAAPAE